MNRRQQTARVVIEARVRRAFDELAALGTALGYGPDTNCQHSVASMRRSFEARAERAINEIESGSRE